VFSFEASYQIALCISLLIQKSEGKLPIVFVR